MAMCMMVREKEKTKNHQNHRLGLCNPQPRELYRSNIVKPNPLQQSWKESTLDCIPLFVGALLRLPELIQARNVLAQVVREVIDFQLKNKEECLRSKDGRLKKQLERGESFSGGVSVVRRDYNNKWKRQLNSDDDAATIHVYGRDVNRTHTVVKDALEKTVLEQHIPVIKLEGKNVDTLSPEGLRTLLLSEYKKCNDSTSVLILVEQCSVNLYENFKNCGFISFARERGVLVTVVCWSTTTKVIGGNGTTTVLVPGPEDNKGEVEPERQDEMIVHKPLVADPRHQAENLKDAETSTESLSEDYADTDQPDCSGITVSEGVDQPQRRSGQRDTAKRSYSNYSTMQPVTLKKQPITTEPLCDQKASPAVQLRTANVSKNKAKEVAVHMGYDDDEYDEVEPGLCGLFTSCIVTTYACLLD